MSQSPALTNWHPASWHSRPATQQPKYSDPKALERAVQLEPEDPQINGHLGDAYWAAGRRLEATYQWRRALTFNPEPADAAKLEAKLQGSPQSTVVSGQ